MKDLLNNTINSRNKDVVYETKLHWISYVMPITMIFILIFICSFVSSEYVQPFINSEKFRPNNGDGQETIQWIVVFVFLLPIFRIVWNIIYLNMITIYLTPKSLTLKQGILSKTLTDISLSKYEGMGLHQSLLGRLLGYGTLSITTGGASQSYRIEEPMKLRQNILELIE